MKDPIDVKMNDATVKNDIKSSSTKKPKQKKDQLPIPPLPDGFVDTLFKADLEFEEELKKDPDNPNNELKKKGLKFRDTVYDTFGYLFGGHQVFGGDPEPINIIKTKVTDTTTISDLKKWPSSCYVPIYNGSGKYWYDDAPEENLFKHEWTNREGWHPHHKASKYSGELLTNYSLDNRRISGDNSVGVGIEFKPQRQLSEITLQAELGCRVFNVSYVELESDQTALGWIMISSSITLAGWELLEGPLGWKSIGSKQIPVDINFITGEDINNNSSSKYDPLVKNYGKYLTGNKLKTTLTVEGGKTYILGVVARVFIGSNFSVENAKGKDILDSFGTLKNIAFGQIWCDVDKIIVQEKKVLKW